MPPQKRVVGTPTDYASYLSNLQKDTTMTQADNIIIAQQLLSGIGEGKAPDALAAMFAEDLRFEIQGDDGVLPWIGRKQGRQAAADFFREMRLLTEPVKFEVEDILGSQNRAVIVGELETRIKSSGSKTTLNLPSFSQSRETRLRASRCSRIALTCHARCVGNWRFLWIAH